VITTRQDQRWARGDVPAKVKPSLHVLLAGQLVHRQFRAHLGIGHAGRGKLGHVARRIDFYDDPAAPKANSLVPSVNVAVTNADGDVLLIRRSDNQNWAVPGGAIDLGESMVQAAVRETKEETGIDCEVTGLVGIYTDPKHVILYTSNGEARQEFSILLTARATGGAPTRSDESSEVRWVPRSSLDGCAMDRSMRLRLGHFLEGRVGPYLG
jgi:ADP-ribose pyrophosphatase YjhB (NUDIX family)